MSGPTELGNTDQVSVGMLELVSRLVVTSDKVIHGVYRALCSLDSGVHIPPMSASCRQSLSQRGPEGEVAP